MTSNCETKFNTKVDTIISESSIDRDQYTESPYYSKIEPLITEFRTTTLAIPTQQDKALLTTNTTILNNYIVTEILAQGNTFPTTYPYLYERFEETPIITPAETNTFIATNGIIPTLFVDTISTNTLDLLNSYYSPGAFSGSGMSSFCALVPNIFGQIQNIKDIFNKSVAFVHDFETLLSDIQDFSLSGLLTNLRNQVKTVIDRIIANVKIKINEFTTLFTRASSYKYNLTNVHTKAIEERQKIESLISDPSVGALKNSIDGALSFVSSLFESLNIEEIQFILLRFCELISNLENFFSDVTRPLQDLVDNYTNAFTTLKGSGSYRTARAVAAGALRFSIDDRTEAETRINTTYTNSIGIGTPQNDNATVDGVAVRQRSARILPVTAEEADAVMRMMSYDVVRTSASPYIFYQPGPMSASSGRLGWDNVGSVEKVMIMRLAKALGVKLHINSAWRSLETQARIRANNSGIPKSGYHQSGQAFDVSRVTINNEATFINTARSIGFGGIGRYDTFIHIDSRAADTVFK